MTTTTSQSYLIKYLSESGSEEYKLVSAESISSEGEPAFNIEGVSIFDVLSIQPYV